MRLGRRSFLASTMAAVAAPAVIRLASAAAPQFALKLHHFLSSVSSGHDKFLAPWARKIEADSGQRIRIDIFPSMQLGGQPAQLFDQARDGMADIVWASPSDTPGRFPKIELFELPFVPSRRALVSSKAIEDYARLNLADEFRDVHPICFSCSDRAVVHTNRPIHTIDEIRDLKLHVQTRFAGEALRALGALAVPMPSAQLPLAISRHIVDGCVDPWNMVPALKLDTLLKTHTEFAESSLSTTTFVLAMNKAAYDRLPRDLKAVIDSNAGQFAAGMAGTAWDLQAAMVADMVSQRGEAITTLLPEAVAHWRNATEPVIESWLKQMKERKVDGGKLLASARASLAKYADEPEPQPPQPVQAQQPPEAKPEISPPARPDAAPAPPKAPVANAGAAPAPASPLPPAAPAPTVTTVAPVPAPSSPLPPAAPAPVAPAPVVKPAPAAAAPPKILDIPL
jgi:TRAP-type C4-dicarboxylate transport system substrate-binding protein